MPSMWFDTLDGMGVVNGLTSSAEGFRDKIAKPLIGLIVIGVLGVLGCLEKLCKSLRPPTVFGWTTSFTLLAHVQILSPLF
jgi:hypothetical protein